MELPRLRPGEAVAGLAGVVLIVAMLLIDWYGVDVPPGAAPPDGFNAFGAFDVLDVYLLALALAAIVLPILSMARETPAAAISTATFLTLAAIVASVALLLRIVNEPDLADARPEFALISGFDITLQTGVFIGLAATVAIAVGGWLAMRDDGTG